MDGSGSRDALHARGRAVRGTSRAAILSLALLPALMGSAVGADAEPRAGDGPTQGGVVCGLAHAGGYAVVCARRQLPEREPRPGQLLGSLLLPQSPPGAIAR
ncbi:hypothetical protein G5T42_04225 [Microbacterium sp. 4R-513]|uniref:hypothetical protein n=1 Tax=Microbacterium sp. 4R-513 TaxID=2567934 RepID=UPI0013E1931A|nr:hypothetical protein [Microbacterium sp. 4R-513]QIG38789.1 hypothetical protein G5T42_04225 [Microbacterium sp. 4R-513]